MKKYLVVLIIICVIVTLMPQSAKAITIETEGSNSTKYYTIVRALPTGGTVTIRIPETYEVDENRISMLVMDNSLSDGDIITLYDKSLYMSDNMENTVGQISPRIDSIVDTFYKTYVDYGEVRVYETYKLLSVAKGMTVTLERSHSKTYSATFTPEPFVSAEIAGSLYISVNTTVSFSGPAEDSEYNSREFRIRVYERDVEWTQEKYYYWTLVYTLVGTAVEKFDYDIYSVDKLIVE